MPVLNYKKIINFNEDYYAILLLDKNHTQSHNIFLKNLDQNFRKQARQLHPDYGGDPNDFKLLVRAKQILEDPHLKKIYDSGAYPEETLNNTEFNVDWSTVGTYRKGTTADTLGYSFFIKLSQHKEELGLIPTFMPKTNYDNYEWTFSLSNKPSSRLSISLVYDENEVLRLSSGEKLENYLNFKIYVCIPTQQLTFKRDANTLITFNNNKILSPGKVQYATFDDFVLLETASLDEAHAFFDDIHSLQQNIQNYLNNEGSTYHRKSQQIWMDENTMNKIDAEILQRVLKIKSFEVTQNNGASDFLDSIK